MIKEMSYIWQGMALHIETTFRVHPDTTFFLSSIRGKRERYRISRPFRGAQDPALLVLQRRCRWVKGCSFLRRTAGNEAVTR